MGTQSKVLEKMILRAHSGEGAHVGVRGALEGLDWKVSGVRPDGSSHSIFQLLTHVNFWQEWVVKWLDGKKPSIPKHAAASWTERAAPARPEDWEQAVCQFKQGLEAMKRQSGQADLLSDRRGKSRLEMLQTIALHNSYHLGQVVLLRQMLGAWPPPSGGLTW